MSCRSGFRVLGFMYLWLIFGEDCERDLFGVLDRRCLLDFFLFYKMLFNWWSSLLNMLRYYLWVIRVNSNERCILRFLCELLFFILWECILWRLFILLYLDFWLGYSVCILGIIFYVNVFYWECRWLVCYLGRLM